MGSAIPSFRRTLSFAVGAVALVAVLASAALMTLTTSLSQSAAALARASEAAHHLEEAEVDLLLYERASHPLTRASLRAAVRSRLALVLEAAPSEEERAAIRTAQRAADAYFAAEVTGDPAAAASFEEAFEAVENLLLAAVARSELARRNVDRWDRTGNVLGAAMGLSVSVAVLFLLWWLTRRAFRPMLQLGDAMKRFTAGNREARAPVRGHAEFRSVAECFNHMADALARQREHQFEFLAGVAHDLRNPLGALRLSAAQIRPNRALPPEDRIRSTFLLIDRQISRLDRMIGDLMDTARIDAGHLELELEQADVVPLARHAVELFQAVSPSHVLTVRSPDVPIVVQCDPGRVEQVLNNLISNAIKYSPVGGEIVIDVGVESGAATLAVQDPGIGITAEEQRRLFQPFLRVGKIATEVPGTGMGLYISRRIVEAHGGELSVHSQPGVGSTFTMKLPRSAAEAGAPAQAH